MTGGRALILAGTGMLPEAAETLVRQGWRVVLPSRRYQPLAVPEIVVPETKPGIAALQRLRPPGHLPQAFADDMRGGRAVWVEASWDRPAELANKAATALDGEADLLVAWVHDQYRVDVMRAVEPLLARTAGVVEVRTSDWPLFEPEPVLAEHPTQLVLLGAVSEPDYGRAPSHS